MKRKYFNILLQLFAFLVPIYFIFYPALNDKPKDPFTKSLWLFVGAGFSFYGVIALVIYITK